MPRWNLGLRFGLEVAAVGALGVAGHHLVAEPFGWVAAIAVPAIAVLAWGTFNVVDDPSRSGAAPVEVTGAMRLGVEALVLGGAVAATWYVGRPVLAVAFGALVVVQYATAFGRVRWLLGR